ncbi:MAG: ABC transporter ATP-binding protein [Mesorhizobium sp.]|uniref:ABC transporter ATP-binding protein n=1 Tax=unclassified Mesorhizobium TaxID=325217 RepID=UPI000FCA41F7|nr:MULTISPECIES: ABC transporter ATP-binding protein [unclassified Mesorhizobium]RUY13214.1 ABC transporter ATP-binding protein [Mesorhizobium sp. M2A.F.Ca.ET.040.01.1.1]RUU25491.1 ABC transporter ATP-binding protein [Mesorhizobium sp. M6A.T.Ce.TU.016.01.1.1]RWB66444.1 MAG: ABC transporter ATP-binding protein [Mesorhizobium sp.]TIN31375.1 MAG: ABC transporter ATP-binding protein [Mesorhizobium sp.]TIN72299.1 MAG: ABC transporter ATP-binding protein [Mesorhizobium sp.]
MSALLRVEDLRVRFRTMGPLKALATGTRAPFIDALCGVSFEIRKGETLALVGESGSGKSTIARTIIGLQRAVSGSISFDGQEIEELSGAERKPYLRRMAMMFQDPIGSLSPRLTVRSLLTEPFRIHGLKDRDVEGEAERLLRMVGLSAEFARRYPHQLSGGQARRVGIARALALSPDLLIADEPTAGLDVSVQGEVLNLLARLQTELGMAILIITHNLNVVRHMTDRMAIMYLGRFIEVGATERIFDQPRHPYTEALLAANPEPDPDAVLNRIELKGEVPSLMRRPSGCEFHTRCRYAQDICSRVFPEPSAGQEDKKHSFRCHFPIAGDILPTSERPKLSIGKTRFR